MSVTRRVDQALGREEAYGRVLAAMEEVETWEDFRELLRVVREEKAEATQTIKDLTS